MACLLQGERPFPLSNCVARMQRQSELMHRPSHPEPIFYSADKQSSRAILTGEPIPKPFFFLSGDNPSRRGDDACAAHGMTNQLNLVEQVALCFYVDGWNGAGMYECGYRPPQSHAHASPENRPCPSKPPCRFDT